MVDREWLAAHLDEVVLVDVRTEGEYAQHIENALNIDFFTLQEEGSGEASATKTAAAFERAGIAKDDPVVLYCEVGIRAKLVADALGKAGWTKVEVYPDGYPGWVAGL